MPWIENVAATNISSGFHYAAGPNSMLISIIDPEGRRPQAQQYFKERHDFEFLDAEDGDAVPEQHKISQAQAQEIVQLLKHALDNRMNVVVHCTAGICRSGAVVEIGVMLGFTDTEKFRSPNLRVKHQMMKSLGWTYEADETHSVNGVALTEDWTNNNEKVFILAAERRKRRQQGNT